MTNTHHSPVAITYARSLLELANEKGQAREIGQELVSLRDLLAAQPVFREYLADPAIGRAERTQALEKIFRGRVSELVYNFIQVMNRHDRLQMLDSVAVTFADLLDAQLGNVDVKVTTAQKLTRDQFEQVRERVSQALGKNAILTESIDDSIIGGLVVKVGDRVVDASVRQQLESMRHQLLSASNRLTRE